MALDQTQNFVRVNVSGTHTSTDTTIQLESGEASNVPDPANGEYNMVWWDDTNNDSPATDPEVEIVRVTGRDTNNDTITVTRGQENTTAVAHDTTGASYRMILSHTSKMVSDIDAANFSTNSVTVGNTSISLGGTGTPEADNLAGNNGTSGQFLQTDGTNLSFADVSGGMTTREKQAFNDIISQMARNDFADNLSEMAYDGGLYDIWRDQSKIDSSSNVTISTLDDGDSEGRIRLNALETVMKIDDFEDGDYTSNPSWSGTATVQSTTVKNGSYAVEISTSGGGSNQLVHDRGSETVDDGQVYRTWLRTDNTSEQTVYALDTEGSGGVIGRNDLISLNLNNDGGFYYQTNDATGTSIATGDIAGSYSADTWYLFEIEVRPSQSEADFRVYDASMNQLGEVTNVSTSGEAGLQYVSLHKRDVASGSSFFDDASYSATEEEVLSYESSGSVTSVSKDLSNDGFSNPPTNLVLSQDVTIPSGTEDITYTVRDGNSNTVTVTQSDVDTEVDVSSLTSTVMEVDVNLSGDGTATPTNREFMAHFTE